MDRCESCLGDKMVQEHTNGLGHGDKRGDTMHNSQVALLND